MRIERADLGCWRLDRRVEKVGAGSPQAGHCDIPGNSESESANLIGDPEFNFFRRRSLPMPPPFIGDWFVGLIIEKVAESVQE
jgi:hypothetical protein